MLNLNDLHFFVQATEQGGFAAAGRRLGVPKSTVSKRVAELEAALGARLIHRTSRSFALSEVGRDFLEHARAALIEAESAEAVVRRRLAEPSGNVRLTASVPVAQFDLARCLPAFMRAYPKVQLQLHATDRYVDLVQEGFDIAVRSHFAPLPDSALIQRRIGAEPVILVAAPAYLEERGVPSRPDHLSDHDGLLVESSSAGWRLRHDQLGEARSYPVPRLVADESLVLLAAAADGLGIVCLPESICRIDVQSGRLNHVLPGWTAGSVTTTILTPHRRGELPAVRAVVDHLSMHLSNRSTKGPDRLDHPLENQRTQPAPPPDG